MSLTTFQVELRFPNGSFSVCNYLKPYLNPINEHTITIVICTNEIFAIVGVPMRVFQYKDNYFINHTFSPASDKSHSAGIKLEKLLSVR